SRARRSLERLVRHRGPHKIKALVKNRLCSEPVTRTNRPQQPNGRSQTPIALTSPEPIQKSKPPGRPTKSQYARRCLTTKAQRPARTITPHGEQNQYPIERAQA